MKAEKEALDSEVKTLEHQNKRTKDAFAQSKENLSSEI